MVKRNNEYMCIETQKLKFLDTRNFLAPGFSYARYLTAFEVTEQKTFFPCEYITCLDKLQEAQLPPNTAFVFCIFSILKKTETLPQRSTLTDNRSGKKQQHNNQTLKDFLIFYNNKDVTSFPTALERQVNIYKNMHIDLLKDGISVPGTTLKYLFQTLETHTYFSLFKEKQRDIYTLLKEQMTGGPSIIFHCYYKADKTHIRYNPQKPIQSIQGYDANALYL